MFLDVLRGALLKDYNFTLEFSLLFHLKYVFFYVCGKIKSQQEKNKMNVEHIKCGRPAAFLTGLPCNQTFVLLQRFAYSYLSQFFCVVPGFLKPHTAIKV